MSNMQTNNTLMKRILKLNNNKQQVNFGVINENKVEHTDALSFKVFYQSILNLFEKRKYRKIYIEIFKYEKSNESQNKENEFILNHFQITAVLCIIKRKIFKFALTNFNNIEKWFVKLYELISILSNNIKILPNHSQPGHYEKITYYYLSYFYLNAIVSKHNKNILDSVNYLCLCEKIINSLYNNITFPETLNIIQQIYLFKSGLLIADKCFDSAVNILKKVIYIAYKEIELGSYISHKNKRNDLSYRISYFLPKSIDNSFYNICICFFQLGVIYENYGLPFESRAMYKESKYFAVTFLLKTNLYLCKFLNNIEIMSCNSKRIFQELINEFNTPSYLRKLKLNLDTRLLSDNNNKISALNNCASCRLFSSRRKYNLLETALTDASIKEIDYDDQDLLNNVNSKPRTKTVKKMTNSIQLMNYLLNKEFKPVIDSMPKCEFNSFSQETKNKVQKQIHIIKSNLRSKTKMRNKSNKGLVLNTNISYLQKSSSKGKLQKIVYDKYIFNKTFQNKISFINHQMDREYRFQKGLLKCKKFEKIYCEPYDTEKIKNNADLFFRYHLTEEQKKIKDNEKRKSEIKHKSSIEIEKLKNSGGDNKKRKTKEKGSDIYFVFLKNLLEKASPELRKEFGLENEIENSKEIENQHFINNIKEIPKSNNNMINQLEFEIDQINKKEDVFKLKLSRKKSQHFVQKSFSSVDEHKKKNHI